MGSNFKSIKVYARTWEKVGYIRASFKAIGYHLNRSQCMDLGLDLMVSSVRNQLAKMKEGKDGKAK
ncbi:hypothetical protein ACD591_10055 [Rufibacter glacialis]|uniref:Uncharacterized protein n=1 Tax=Rufibacter glacialis TaxID=1259555 RepID=A0A5M8Q7L9_9BACT|nr:hypothetical protein [Rufibacter glacialis]KAA6431887.1 hypothetical protein FOE74_17420 [Rufibacter glacialis]GGK80695.1 hypothetical protein GCM10011405_30570 [Rufibacter glacialis]